MWKLVCDFVFGIVFVCVCVWVCVCVGVCACVLVLLAPHPSFFQPAASCLIGVCIDWSSFSLFSVLYFGLLMQLKETRWPLLKLPLQLQKPLVKLLKMARQTLLWKLWMVREPFGKMSSEGQRGCYKIASIAPIVHRASTFSHTCTRVCTVAHILTFFFFIFSDTRTHAHMPSHAHAPTHTSTRGMSCMWLWAAVVSRCLFCSLSALSGGRWWLPEGNLTWRRSPAYLTLFCLL